MKSSIKQKGHNTNSLKNETKQANKQTNKRSLPFFGVVVGLFWGGRWGGGGGGVFCLLFVLFCCCYCYHWFSSYRDQHYVQEVNQTKICSLCTFHTSQSFQLPYHFIVLPRAFHSIFFVFCFASHSIFHRKKCLRACFKNSLQQHPHAGTLTGGSFACSKKNSSFF